MIAIAAAVTLSLALAAPQPIARVNGEPITAERLRREFGRSHQGHERMVVAGASEARQFLDKLVDRTLLLQEAYRMKLDAAPDVAKDVEAYEMRQAAEQLRKVEIEEPAKPTAAEVKAVYDARTKELRDLRQIVCDTKDAAEKARARVEAGGDMDAIAREVSTARSRTMGGFLPQVGWGALDPEAEDLVFATPEGKLTPVHAVRDGWQFFLVDKVTKIDQPPWDRSEQPIKSILELRKRDARERALKAALFPKYDVAFPDVDVSIAALEAAEKSGTAEPFVVTWRGGKLSAAAFAETLAFDRLKELRPAAYQRTVRELLEAAALGNVITAEAKARGLAKSPDVAQRVRERREDRMLQLLASRYIGAKIQITEADVKAWFDAHAGEIATPEQRLIAHIQLPTREAALEVKQALANGEPFDALVKKRSTNADTKSNGGDLGWTTLKETPDRFRSVFALKEGQTTEPLEGNGAWQVLLVRKIAPPQPVAFEAVKDELRKRIGDERYAAERDRWLKQLRAAAKVQIDEKAFDAFVKASEKDAQELERRATMPPHGGPGGHASPGGHSGVSPH